MRIDDKCPLVLFKRGKVVDELVRAGFIPARTSVFAGKNAAAVMFQNTPALRKFLNSAKIACLMQQENTRIIPTSRLFFAGENGGKAT